MIMLTPFCCGDADFMYFIFYYFFFHAEKRSFSFTALFIIIYESVLTGWFSSNARAK